MILKTLKENAMTTKQVAKENEKSNKAKVAAQNLGKKSKK